MNKAELIDAVASDTGLSKKDAKGALESVMNNIRNNISETEKVSLVGFGTFSVVRRAERQGINPATKQPITIAEKLVGKFKPSADFLKEE